MLKTVVLHNIFVETDTIYLFIFQDSLMNQKKSIYLKYKSFVTL